MRKTALALAISGVLCAAPALAAEEAVIYWDSPAGKTLRARIPADADFWKLVPSFAVQATQTYCSVASAITVLNALPINKAVDPAYAPYTYFTQSNYFSPEVARIVSPEAVLASGMTREQMVETLAAHGVKARSIAGDTLDDGALRTLLRKALGDDGQFVLANYFRGNLGQVGGGHWSVLAAYDAQADRVLILDVAKYKYPPAWVDIATLRRSLATIDTASNKARGLVIVSD